MRTAVYRAYRTDVGARAAGVDGVELQRSRRLLSARAAPHVRMRTETEGARAILQYAVTMYTCLSLRSFLPSPVMESVGELIGPLLLWTTAACRRHLVPTAYP